MHQSYIDRKLDELVLFIDYIPERRQRAFIATIQAVRKAATESGGLMFITLHKLPDHGILDVLTGAPVKGEAVSVRADAVLYVVSREVGSWISLGTDSLWVTEDRATVLALLRGEAVP